jgi:hypothetical protein
MRPYTDLPQVAEFMLEESYVTAIQATPGSLRLHVDFAVRPSHPMFRPAAPNEYLCYIPGDLVFSGVRRLTWTDQGRPPAIDSSGEPDYDQLDGLEWEGSLFVLEGLWGRIELTAGDVAVTLAGTEDTSRAESPKKG